MGLFAFVVCLAHVILTSERCRRQVTWRLQALTLVSGAGLAMLGDVLWAIHLIRLGESPDIVYLLPDFLRIIGLALILLSILIPGGRHG